MKNKIINNVPTYVSLTTCFLNGILCDNNPTASTTPSPHNNDFLKAGGSFGYVPVGIVTIGLCIAMFSYIYKNISHTPEPESLSCIGENDVESNALYDL